MARHEGAYKAEGGLGHTQSCVAEALRDCGLQVRDRDCELLARHLDLVIDKNRTLNLTRIDSVEDGAYLHVADSLLLLNAVRTAPAGPLLDIGTGAGFPGIPLSIVAHRRGTLVDSVGKKVAAVREFLQELELDEYLEARHVRVEDLAREQRGHYAVVTARAVAQSNVLVEYAAPLLQGRGRLVIAKARPSEDELDAADRAAALCGLKRVSRETFELPNGRGHREVISYERMGKPSVRLPRATGMAKKNPLGVES